MLLRRAFLVLGLALVFVAPFTPDPVEFAVGAFVPWLVLHIVGTPTLPAAIVSICSGSGCSMARGDASEQMRTATSISVGYMSENYVDLGFPGMLAGVFMIGLFVAAGMSLFHSRAAARRSRCRSFSARPP